MRLRAVHESILIRNKKHKWLDSAPNIFLFRRCVFIAHLMGYSSWKDKTSLAVMSISQDLILSVGGNSTFRMSRCILKETSLFFLQTAKCVLNIKDMRQYPTVKNMHKKPFITNSMLVY